MKNCNLTLAYISTLRFPYFWLKLLLFRNIPIYSAFFQTRIPPSPCKDPRNVKSKRLHFSLKVSIFVFTINVTAVLRDDGTKALTPNPQNQSISDPKIQAPIPEISALVSQNFWPCQSKFQHSWKAKKNPIPITRLARTNAHILGIGDHGSGFFGI